MSLAGGEKRGTSKCKREAAQDHTRGAWNHGCDSQGGVVREESHTLAVNVVQEVQNHETQGGD